jgi:MoxR-like ATPase
VGVTPLGEALRDRYVWLFLDYHTEAEEKEIVHINTGVEDKEIVELAVTITRATRDYKDIRRGASVRGAIDITSLYTQLPGEGYKVWEQAAIMSLVPKIELHDDTQKSPTEVIKTLVKGVFANF